MEGIFALYYHNLAHGLSDTPGSILIQCEPWRCLGKKPSDDQLQRSLYQHGKVIVMGKKCNCEIKHVRGERNEHTMTIGICFSGCFSTFLLFPFLLLSLLPFLFLLEILSIFYVLVGKRMYQIMPLRGIRLNKRVALIKSLLYGCGMCHWQER